MPKVYVLGAGVDATTGIEMPLSNELLPCITEFLTTDQGKILDGKLRSMLPQLRFRFDSFIEKAIDNMARNFNDEVANIQLNVSQELQMNNALMIGLLKSLGATNQTVRGIFRHFAIMLVGRGLLWGNAIGLGLCWLQQQFGLVKLNPDTYYIDSVPIQFNWIIPNNYIDSILIVNVVTLAISALVIYGASYLMSIKNPASTMRFE